MRALPVVLRISGRGRCTPCHADPIGKGDHAHRKQLDYEGNCKWYIPKDLCVAKALKRVLAGQHGLARSTFGHIGERAAPIAQHALTGRGADAEARSAGQARWQPAARVG